MIPNKNELINLIQQNMTREEIGKAYGKSPTTVSVWFKKYNLKSQLIGGARNIKDLIGLKFGRLIVVDLFQIGAHGKEYICKCDCGNTTIQRGSSLTSGYVVSCGCNKAEKVKISGALNFKDYYDKKYNKEKYIKLAKSHINEKHNYLTIVDVEYNANDKSFKYICECNCGNITKQIYSDLKFEKVKSCGCYQKEQASITGSSIGLNNYKNKYNWYFVKNNKKINCRSGYEVFYANYLIMNNINFEYESKCFVLSKSRRYTPDFYLTDEDKYIEIKGSFKMNNSHQKENIEIFKNNYKLDILYWDDIVQQCNLPLKSYSSYLRRATKLGIKEEDYLANLK